MVHILILVVCVRHMQNKMLSLHKQTWATAVYKPCFCFNLFGELGEWRLWKLQWRLKQAIDSF